MKTKCTRFLFFSILLLFLNTSSVFAIAGETYPEFAGIVDIYNLLDNYELPVDTNKSYYSAFLMFTHFKLDDPSYIHVNDSIFSSFTDDINDINIKGNNLGIGLTKSFGHGFSVLGGVSYTSMKGSLESSGIKSDGSITNSFFYLSLQISPKNLWGEDGMAACILSFWGTINIGVMSAKTSVDYIDSDMSVSHEESHKTDYDHTGVFVQFYWPISFDIYSTRLHLIPNIGMFFLEAAFIKMGFQVRLDVGEKLSFTFNIGGFFNYATVDIPGIEYLEDSPVVTPLEMKTIKLGVSYRFDSFFGSKKPDGNKKSKSLDKLME